MHPNFTYYSTNHENHKPEWHTSIRSPADSNGTSTASRGLQIDEGNFTKELILDPNYSSDII